MRNRQEWAAWIGGFISGAAFGFGVGALLMLVYIIVKYGTPVAGW
jgi:hypothetical protein